MSDSNILQSEGDYKLIKSREYRGLRLYVGEDDLFELRSVISGNDFMVEMIVPDRTIYNLGKYPTKKAALEAMSKFELQLDNGYRPRMIDNTTMVMVAPSPQTNNLLKRLKDLIEEAFDFSYGSLDDIYNVDGDHAIGRIQLYDFLDGYVDEHIPELKNLEEDVEDSEK